MFKTDDERFGVIGEIEAQMVLAGSAVGGLVYEWLRTHSSRVESNSYFDIWARNVLSYCERYGWIEDPALLVSLLDKIAVRAITPYGAQIPGVAARVRNEKPDIANFFRGGRVWDTCLLSLALPLLNRDITRKAFEDFFNPLSYGARAARVLVVDGPQGSGKTFTENFLRLLVGLRGDPNGVAEADFSSLTAETLTPDRLVVHLAQQMGIDKARAEADMRRLRAPQPERWAKEIAIWMAGEANRTGKTWHILLDNLHQKGVPEQTFIFIELMMAALAGEPIAWDVRDQRMGPPLRLVLLGYRRELPERKDFIRVDKITPLTPQNLKTHFERFYSYKQWPVDDAEIDSIVARYEPRLPSLFPLAAVAQPGEADAPPEEAPPWKMREVADVVMLDCADMERRHGAPTPPSVPVPAGTAVDNGN
jgi:hypothetical protein